MPTFKIEQLAIAPRSPKAMQLLRDMGITEWVEDHVTAIHQTVYPEAPHNQNTAHLRFNYSALAGNELEVLEYTDGWSWLDAFEEFPVISHIGMHCSAEELEEWREFMRTRDIPVAQEVKTIKHTNPVIAGKRQYHYVVFDTRDIIGCDVKFIVREVIG